MKNKKYNQEWISISKSAEAYAQGMDIGLLAVDRFDLGQIREKEGAALPALRLYCHSFYYHSTGISNLKEFITLNKIERTPPCAYIPPAVVNRIRIVLKKNSLSPDTLKDFFQELSGTHSVPFALFSPEEAYGLLLEFLEKGVDTANKIIMARENHWTGG